MITDSGDSVSDRRAPCQESNKRNPDRKSYPLVPAGTIEWWEHELAWKVYSRKYGASQSAERIAERGGFGWEELITFLGHEPETWKSR